MPEEINEASLPILANRCCINKKGLLYIAFYFGDWAYSSPVTGVFAYPCQTKRKNDKLLIVDNHILTLLSEL